ncbi:anthranilate phosphoribosyltransferase [Pseudobacteroides cellulosolvens]|uniref:Anthranilate phosphoribosyltransferase n=1 Tax=Pseudobacteroides cellulosolvens ATCC 35603 = DSM 2933 TaxID=398512 RepID=A0A0L6JHG7_9FIRM|nr:anthranilate phosphoribosyltransferase [Pseudobacteroides cellulosolvens]KNY25281.1 Anthranilate phosphoribosyltransferase [Pseudobacteroides cellulosolvens ATCC 35603 = DSM 2933]
MIQEAIKKLITPINLTEDEVVKTMSSIMEGNATPAQIGSFITALRIKGETVEEITGCARVMRDKAERFVPDLDFFIDTCGTGGDGSNSFNISTAAAIVASAGGVPVAKHGNRSVSSMTGCADVLEALGVNINITSEQAKKCIEDIGICFMFAPMFHKSMKYAAGPRKELGIRTIFNVLGPLTNPAGAKGQVMGVFDCKLTETLAKVLLKLGTERAMVVHGMDGMDEITTTTSTLVSEVMDGKVLSYEIKPEDFGIKVCSKSELTGGDAKANSQIIVSIFNGEKGPKRDIVLLNSAAALYVGKKVRSLKDGIELAGELIDTGKASNKLDQLVSYTTKL